MSSLFKQLRVHQIFGANTDVGKTILTTALVRASALKEKSVFYLKPISTGPIEDADDKHVMRFGGKLANKIHAECLFRYNEPVSPHLAAKLMMPGDQSQLIPSDENVVNSIANRIRAHAGSISKHAHMYVETAGGVHSPCLSGSTQADCYRPLFLPTILVGDSKLGGISSTIASYESLLLRGYIIDAVILFQDQYYRNWEYLQPYFAERGIHVSAVHRPPEVLADPSDNFKSTEDYYNSITSTSEENTIPKLVDYLDNCHNLRLHELESMPRRTLDTVWWPFVQHGFVQSENDVTVIDSAYGDFFSVCKRNILQEPNATRSILAPEFDGSASWWTQTMGHAHPSLTLAAAQASGRYGHVMFPQATHLPALNLAERMVHDGPGRGWASRAFFSDNGSTGMEVALKMALRAFSLRHGKGMDSGAKKDLGILGLKGSYHGDTIGAMDACEEGVYTCEWHDAKGYWFEPPSVGIKDGKIIISIPPSISATPKANEIRLPSLSSVYDIEGRLRSSLARAYTLYIERTLEKLEKQGRPKLAALVIEPLVMGAGGMIFVDPLFQRVLIDVVRGRRSGSSSSWSGMPVIFDEVFVGLHRIGMESAGPLLGIYPDISVNAKVLTGGLIPMAITLASKSIFEAFLSDNKAEALLHGHSYTAHPIGCEVANKTLQLLDDLQTSDDWKAAQERWRPLDGTERTVWSFWDPTFVRELSKLPEVDEVMTLGCVLALKVKDASTGYTSQSAQTLLQKLRQFDDGGIGLSVAPGGDAFSVHFRTLGDVAYFITSLNTSPSVIRSIEDRIWKTIAR
ncbi:pyridoxal phosphate-dependent transferase [Crucibulum laeve]|uniref:Pyridoxal phosphate-dependent transferase n=1 Tax=Crucibulum laeve TaxID=68775 RepID=A0A5C3MGD5_9AGAR|nr:pyridoxal phosphate-dependent transferase [Crucibulum laeve]